MGRVKYERLPWNQYEADFSKVPEDERERAACLEAVQYLGQRRARAVWRVLRREKDFTYEQFRQVCWFPIGIEGYPVKAMWNRTHVPEERRP
jgi:hypothetical protein